MTPACTYHVILGTCLGPGEVACLIMMAVIWFGFFGWLIWDELRIRRLQRDRGTGEHAHDSCLEASCSPRMLYSKVRELVEGGVEGGWAHAHKHFEVDQRATRRN